MQVAALQQFLPQRARRRAVRVGEERVLDDDGGPAARLQALDEMLQEQERRLPRLDREILLHLRPLLPAERRIGQDHVEAVLFLNVARFSASVLVWTMFGASMPCRIMFIVAMT